ncbi:MAG TPA: hypothetical protein VGN34_16350 [Ktedonobacteraceae bacterium]
MSTMPRSVLRHRPIYSEVQEWVVATPRTTTQHPRRAQRAGALVAQARQAHPVVIVGLSMLITLLLLCVAQSIWSWGHAQLDTWQYGYPRSMQRDQTVGHEVGHTLSHFEAMNIRGQIYVLEIPGGNSAGSRLYVGPHLVGANADLAPVILTFQGDSRHLDMFIEVQGLVIHFKNTGKTYVLAAP